ncbi:MAG TPA: LuxR C-terminal-related transcriptional regulator, partial [Acidimicrobiia bacterium]|nr:LuxR C-terminal-related transcriptional regulator [Acidimicrobiia bacterium]
EAGHGKSSLLGAFLSTLDHRFRLLVGGCEPLGQPLAFGPLFDLLDELPSSVADELRSGAARPVIYRQMAECLSDSPTVLVIEDVQWADEATLGLIRQLGRRVADTSSVVIATCRPEEIAPAHPFRVVLADVGHLAVRIDLPALSEVGVMALTDGTELDSGLVHAATLGNPFFVEEIVRNPDQAVPDSIADAILARVASLSPTSREVLELVSLTPDGLELDAAATREIEIDSLCERRLLTVTDSKMRCRHDLIRATVEESVPPARRRRLHADIVGFLEGTSAGHQREARLAYHSHAAGLDARAAEYCVTAAAAAASVGAHREAARSYGWALEHRSAFGADQLAAVLRSAAYEYLLINDNDQALEVVTELLGLASDPLERARAEGWVALVATRGSMPELAERWARSAAAVLEPRGPSVDLARAQTVLATVELMTGHWSAALITGQIALDTARKAKTPACEADALITVGTAMVLDGRPSGFDLIEEGGAIARGVRSLDSAARAVNNAGTLSFREMNLQEAAQRMDRALDYLAAEELDAWYVAVDTTRAHISVLEGDWDSAAAALERVLPRQTCRSTEAEARLVAALREMRMGAAQSLATLDLALARTDLSGTYSEEVLAGELAMEAAWLGLIDIGAAADRYTRMLSRALEAGDVWAQARLGFWALRLGLEPPEGPLPGPVGHEMLGDAGKAAAAWRESGYRVEAAITEAFTEGASLRDLFTDLEAMGATGVIEGLRRRLRQHGVGGVPRGVQQAAAHHPAKLTDRQQEVLELMAAGLSNEGIATELFISPKTAAHHVSAVLSKLGVGSRAQAASVAHANGWL